MFARVFNGVWKENVDAIQRAWDRLKAPRSAGSSADHNSSEHEERKQPTFHVRVKRKVLGGITAAIAVLALTYSAASALVTGAAGSSAARSDYITVMMAASTEYRRSRADCLALPLERRDLCVADAHVNEGKLRTAVKAAPRKQLSQMREKSDQLLLAAEGLDSIVIEPACNVVARGSASVCEIQVKGSTVEGPDTLASARPGPDAAAGVRAVSSDGLERAADAQWVSVSGRDRRHYFANVAGRVAP